MEEKKLEIGIVKTRIAELKQQLKDKNEDAERARNVQQQLVGQFFLIQGMIAEEEKKLKQLEKESISKGTEK